MKNITCVVVTAFFNHPEAFASDLGDDQSRYLLYIYTIISTYATAFAELKPRVPYIRPEIRILTSTNGSVSASLTIWQNRQLPSWGGTVLRRRQVDSEQAFCVSEALAGGNALLQPANECRYKYMYLFV